MIKRLICMLVLGIFFALPVYAGEKILSEGVRGNIASEILVDAKGDIWIAYYDASSGIHIRNVSNGKDLVFKEGAERVSKGFAFAVQGEHIFLVWREKLAGKKLYFRASHDGGNTLSEPVMLDDNTTQALSRIKIGANARGDVFVTWLSEKSTETSDYSIYAVSSNDFGKTFAKPINLTAGYTHSIYPTILVDEENAYSFSYSEKNKKQYMIFSRTTDRGKTWSGPSEIKEIGVVTLFIEPIKIGKRLHVFWFNTYGNEAIPVIEDAYSDDEGRTWKCTAFEDTKGLDVGSLKVSSDPDGHIYLALAGKWDEKQKSKVYVIASDDNGTTWGKAVSVRHYPYDLTTAMNPVITASDNAGVAVVWEDYRNIRSNLYMQYSKDGGKTWQENDVPLEEPGRFNTGLWQHSNSIVRLKDTYYVLSARSQNDKLLKELLLLTDFTPRNRGAK
jgi:hypothetical protein